MTNRDPLNGGAFNLLYGRDPEKVEAEVKALVKKHDLQFLNVQEAADYFEVLRSIPGFNYYTGSKDAHRGMRNNGVLVLDDLRVDKVRTLHYGDGWRTKTGSKSFGVTQQQVRLEGWFLDRSVHMPTPSHWEAGKIVHTPPERKDDLILNMRALDWYFRPPRVYNAACAAGDFNENPYTRGQYSPQWLEDRNRARIYVPTSRQGHGRIDWFIVKGATIQRVFKDTDIHELSDHEPVIAKGIKKTGRR